MNRSLAIAVCAGTLFSLASDCMAEGMPERRITPDEMSRLEHGGAGPGTSGMEGINTTILSGDPSTAGPYVIRLVVPANMRIEAHAHRDDRSAVVVSGQWSIGYGDRHERSALKVLPPGSFYTEPAGVPHFASSGAEAVVVYISGYGPTDTRFQQ